MATREPVDIPTPDDSGSDTFERFRYQAMVALRFCVDCGLGGRTQSVIAEHLEDLAVHQDSSWRFIQVKTRNPQRGPWRLSDLLSDNGALHSLLRCHRVLGEVECTLEVFLEGPIDGKDRLSKFSAQASSGRQECVETIATKLGLVEPELSEFVGRVRVFADFPHRALIESDNLGFLGRAAPDLTYAELVDIHGRIIEVFCEAMASGDTGSHYPRAVIEPETIPDGDTRALVARKHLTRDRLGPLCANLASKPRPLIARMVEPHGDTPTVLEQKLIAGGAPAQIVADAKELRANAASRKLELLAMGGLDREIEDVRQSLRLRTNSQVALHEDKPRPARYIWDGLLQMLTLQASAIDPNNHFGRAEFLLGEVCELADECTTNWGVASAV